MTDDNQASIAGFQAGYIDVAGSPIWHEVAGHGPPVVLLHGGFSGANSWSLQAAALTDAGFHVRAPERAGHGHTPDAAGPFSYEAMAEETIAYLETAVEGKAHLVGRSDGAVVALLTALRRPDLVDRMVLISKFYNSDGRQPGTDFEKWLHGDKAKAFLRQAYGAVSPDGPEHFEIVHAKTMAMIESGPELDLTSLTTITAPALVLQGDRDVVTLAHGHSVASALADGRLAVLPGTHSLPTELPDVVNPLLTSFLKGQLS